MSSETLEAVERLNDIAAQMDVRLPVAFTVKQQTQHAADLRLILTDYARLQSASAKDGEALRPFAEHSDCFIRDTPWTTEVPITVMVGDLREAKAALARKATPPAGQGEVG